MVESVELALQGQELQRPQPQHPAVVEDLPLGRGVEPLPVEVGVHVPVLASLDPLEPVLDRPGQFERGNLQRLQEAVSPAGLQGPQGADRGTGGIAEAQDRLHLVEEVIRAPAPVPEDAGEKRGAIASLHPQRRGELPAQDGLADAVRGEELGVVAVQSDQTGPGDGLAKEARCGG